MRVLFSSTGIVSHGAVNKIEGEWEREGRVRGEQAGRETEFRLE